MTGTSGTFSVTTIEKALAKQIKEGYILKVGGGRSTAYIINNLQ